jgi:hypothetical protein
MTHPLSLKVGTRKHWEHDVREFVDVIQFSLCDAHSQAPIAMPDGSPAVWALPGQVCDWRDNFDCPFFTVTQVRMSSRVQAGRM